MKWRDLYNTLQLLPIEEQPDTDIRNCLERMARQEVFRFAVLHLDDGPPEKTMRCPNNVDLVIEQVRVSNLYGELRITVKTQGFLPPGFKHGTYVLTLTHGQFFDDLPKEMFEDEEAPEDELEEWVEEVVENIA